VEAGAEEWGGVDVAWGGLRGGGVVTRGAEVTKVAFFFSLGDRVTLSEIGQPGVVTGLLHEQLGDQYRVTWWNNGERKTEWLFGHELAARNKQS
jgi:hypothetical protein